MPVHRRATPSIKFAGTQLYTWVEGDTVREKCFGLEPGQLAPEACALTMRPFWCLLNVLVFVLLQLLAGHFEWFQDAFDKMTKDGRETQWRQITEHDKPELVALPDGLDEK